jgi:hypothetical protein
MLGSFKHKLAVYFLLLAVAPLTAAFWGFGTVAKRDEERRVDSRLEAELRAVSASYDRQAGRALALARKIARRRDVQQGLRRGNFSRLPPGVAVLGPHRLAVGRGGTIESTQTVQVMAGRHVFGSILALLPLDRSLLRQLRVESGLAHGDRIVFVPRWPGSRRSRSRYLLQPGRSTPMQPRRGGTCSTSCSGPCSCWRRSPPPRSGR